MKPLCIDLFCGLGGWTEGFLAEGWNVIGFDIEQHAYWLPEIEDSEDGMKGTESVEKRGWTQGCAVSLGLEGANAKPRTRLVKYPAQLVIQDVLTLHGSQFRNADIIVASPPCQAYSYRAMPWKRAKALPPPDNTLFEACFRIQREACEATRKSCDVCGDGPNHPFNYENCRYCKGLGYHERHIPLIVENVRGAQKWVGRSAWNYGSFHLWGDVPALMPIAGRAQKFNPDGTNHGTGSWFAIADSKNRGSSVGGDGDRNRKSAALVDGYSNGLSNPGSLEGEWNSANTARASMKQSPKQVGFGQVPSTNSGRKVGMNFHEHEKTGKPGRSFQSVAVEEKRFGWRDSIMDRGTSKGSARKAASAQIAKIPFPLSSHIARVFKPRIEAAA